MGKTKIEFNSLTQLKKSLELIQAQLDSKDNVFVDQAMRMEASNACKEITISVVVRNDVKNDSELSIYVFVVEDTKSANSNAIIVASVEAESAKAKAISFCQDNFGGSRLFEVVDGGIAMEAPTIARLKKYVEENNGDFVAAVFNVTTDAYVSYHGDDRWVCDGETLNEKGVLVALIKAFYSKTNDERTEVLSYIANNGRPSAITQLPGEITIKDQLSELPMGIDSSISDVLADSNLSIYEVEVGVFDYSTDTSKPRDFHIVLVGAGNIDNAELKVIDFCETEFGGQNSFEVVDGAYVTMKSSTVRRLKQAVEEGSGGAFVADIFNDTTSVSAEFLGDGTWVCDDKRLDEKEVIVALIKAVYLKDADDMDAVFDYIDAGGRPGERMG